MLFPIVDLYFTYRDDRPKLCYVLEGLADDEIKVLLEAMKRRFDKSEPDAFTFSIKISDEYSPLERVERQRGGDWADSGINSLADKMLASMNLGTIDGMNVEQQRWLNVRNTTIALCGDINRLRIDLCLGPSKSSILSVVSRDELLAHLDSVEYRLPELLGPKEKLDFNTGGKSLNGEKNRSVELPITSTLHDPPENSTESKQRKGKSKRKGGRTPIKDNPVKLNKYTNFYRGWQDAKEAPKEDRLTFEQYCLHNDVELNEGKRMREWGRTNL